MQMRFHSTVTFIDSSEGEAVEASKFLDLSRHGFNDVLSLCVGASPLNGT